MAACVGIAQALPTHRNDLRAPLRLLAAEDREPLRVLIAEIGLFGSSAVDRDSQVCRVAELLLGFSPHLADPSSVPAFGIADEGCQALAGICGLIPDDDHRSAEFFFGLHHDYRRRRLASGAARSALHYAFSSAGLASVFAWVADSNASAQRALEAAGMRMTGQSFRLDTWFQIYTATARRAVSTD